MRIIAFLLLAVCGFVTSAQAQPAYQIEKRSSVALSKRFTPAQIALLEKLNRADRNNLSRLPELVVPTIWTLDELAYCPLPQQSTNQAPTSLVVDLTNQVFGAYEFGRLVRWGPVNTGKRGSPTPSGSFSLNWRSRGHYSSINPEWFMKWYFNFQSRRGLAFHEYVLPGLPVSHGCIRMLSRDAIWLYGWGESWVVGKNGKLLKSGTPVHITGAYDFKNPPPWRAIVR